MSTEAMKLALEALGLYARTLAPTETQKKGMEAITALREALAQPQQEPLQNIPSLTTVLAYLERLVPSEVYTGMIDVIEDEFQRKQQPEPAQQQEPVAIVDDSGVIVVCSYHYKPGDKLYTVPPARKPLTDKELEEIVKRGAENKPFHHWFARAIEAAHGIKGDA